MPRRYEIEHKYESSTDDSPVEGPRSPWTGVDGEYFNFNPNKDGTGISVIDGRPSPPFGSLNSKTDKRKMAKTAERRFQILGGLCATIAISVVLTIGAIIALAVILTRDSSVVEVQTTPVPYRNVIYLGEMRLLEDWREEYNDSSSVEFKEKSTNISQQLDKAFLKSVLWRYYKNSQVISLRNGSILSTFQLLFSVQQEYTPLDGGQSSNMSVSPNMIATALVDQFLAGIFSLPLDIKSVVIQEVATTTTLSTEGVSTTTEEYTDETMETTSSVNETSTKMVTPSTTGEQMTTVTSTSQKTTTISQAITTTMSTSSSTTTTTKPESTTQQSAEGCHTVEFQSCKGFYNYTVLPSQNQTEAGARFDAFFSGIISRNCSQNALPFFCATSFPACDAVTGEAIPPCRQLCQDVASSCFLTLPCSEYPESTEKCYEGVAAASTIAPSSTTTTTSPSSTPQPAEGCHTVEFQSCKGFYDYTVLPSQNQTEAGGRFDAFFSGIISRNCSQNALPFFCATSFPACDARTGEAIPPCRQLCQDVASSCFLTLPCSEYPESTETCYEGVAAASTIAPSSTTTTTMSPSSTPQPAEECHTVEFQSCKGFYDYTVLPSPNQTEAGARFNAVFSGIISRNCSQNALPFFCATSFPACDARTGDSIPPCRQLCQDVASSCFLNLLCSQYPESPETCYEGVSTTTTTTMSPTPMTTTLQPAGKCHSLEFEPCNSLYDYTVLPSQNQTEAGDRFNAFFSNIISQNCSQNALHFFCSSTLPLCDEVTGDSIPPCRQLCEDVASKCSLQLPCSRFPKSPESCYLGGLTTTTPVTPSSTTTPGVTTPRPAEGCHTVEFQSCEGFYDYTVLPSQNQTEAGARFNAVFSGIISRNCSQNALPFFCTSSFPICDGRSGKSILPCKHLCQDVGASCSLDLPCSQLPEYPQTCYDAGLVIEITTPVPDLCEVLVFDTCQSLYNYTKMPASESQSQSIVFFEQALQPIIDRGCSSKARELFCSLRFPMCDSRTGKTYGPCRKLCEEVATECNLLLTCSQFADTDCLYNGLVTAEENVTTTTAPQTTTPDSGLCSAVKVPQCHVLYATTVLSANQNEDDLIQRFESYSVIINSNCSTFSSAFLCSNTFPRCEPTIGLPRFPCRDLCTEFMNSCGSLFQFSFNCELYPSTDCVSLNEVSLETTTVSVATTPSPGCDMITSPSCESELPYRFTLLPNRFEQSSMSNANQLLDFFLSNDSKCRADEKAILCSLSFPRCENGQKFTICQAVCDMISPDCRVFLRLNCADFQHDDDPNVCTTVGLRDSIATPPECSGFLCTNYKCLSDMSMVCNGVDNCDDMSDELFCGEESVADCSFEEGNLCGYTQNSNEDFHWTIHSQSTPSFFTGPQFDNTFKNITGHYLYLEATGVPPWTTTNLIFPERQWEEHCFRFNYHMKGEGMGMLKISTFNQGTNVTDLKFVRAGHMGDNWLTGEVTLPRGAYSILIEGLRGLYYTSDMALDDITSRPGACPIKTSDCQSDEFTCKSTGECVPQTLRCDTFNDCGDFSDEMECECTDRQFYFQCNYGNCIGAHKQCDNNIDCPDGSDELDCVCPNGQVQCPNNGSCIMFEWICDGENDCPNGWDEENCSQHCSPDQHVCQDYSCVNQSEVCDGINHCNDGSDENACVRRRSWNNMLEVKYESSWFPVCHSNWNESLGDQICQMNGDGAYLGTVNVSRTASEYLVYDNQMGASYWQKNLNRSEVCDGDMVVGLQCQEKGCGTRVVSSVRPYIIGGQPADSGKWPWMASLTRKGLHICGGSLIAPEFILTAAHCINQYVDDVSQLKVVLGGTSWRLQQPNRKEYAVAKVIPHPQYVSFRGYDVALIQLQRRVEYGPYINPVCLPSLSEIFSTTSLCYVTGWGGDTVGVKRVEDLQEAKMKLWPISKCNSTLAWDGVLPATDFCAGYLSGEIGTCHGDSGGPLMCMDQTRRWKQVGISSYVHQSCQLKPPVFTSVQKTIDWVHDNIECKFQCDNGRCLYDNELICNSEDDCGDNSDEMRLCVSSLNCTFDGTFLCGYTFSPYAWQQKSGLGERSPYPSHDHTLGVFPGRYMASNVGGSLRSPNITVETDHCVQFYYTYLTSAQLSGKFTVYIDFFTSAGSVARKRVFEGPTTSNVEAWRMAQFVLPTGTSQVIFEGDIKQQVAIDDVLATPGDCRVDSCQTGEFYCSKSGCMRESVRCNLAVNCPLTDDDEICEDRRPYTCTFENNLECGITRPYQFLGNDWVVQNSQGTSLVKADHTLSNSDGLFIISSGSQTSSFGITLLLPEVESCLYFHYQILSNSATLKVEGTWRASNQSVSKNLELLSIKGERSAVWNPVSVTIPPAPGASATSMPSLYLTFTFMTSSMEKRMGSFAAIDDVVIMQEQCPLFTCPEGYLKCDVENYCISLDKICDGRQDCADYSDELNHNCSCSESQFKCDNGLCISNSATCNGRADCLDESDEAQICDHLRSVSCDFEDEFLCGYRITNSSAFAWIRNQGSTDSRSTGPSSDHTFGNISGHYMYTEASYGNSGDIANLTSPIFSTTPSSSVQFYYHMRGTNVQDLRLYSSSPTSPWQQVWSKSGDLGNQWNMACVSLPAEVNLTLTFVVARGDDLHGDFAIDDVTIINTCPMPTTTPPNLRQTTTQSPCPAGQRPCQNGNCLDASLFCNRLPDCTDGSDEFNCP